MQIAPEVSELVDLAKAANVPISRALRRANIPSSTYWRWLNKGSEPSTRTVRNLRAAIQELSGEAA